MKAKEVERKFPSIDCPKYAAECSKFAREKDKRRKSVNIQKPVSK